MYNHIFPESLLIWRVTDESQHCTMKGILCLTIHADFLSRQKTRWSDKEGLDCSCLPGCEEPEFNVVRTETHKYDWILRKNAWYLLLKWKIKIYKLGFSNKLIVSILSFFFFLNGLVLVIKHLIDWVQNLNILTGLLWWFMKTDELYWYLVKLNQTFLTNRLLIQLFELTFDHLSAK